MSNRNREEIAKEVSDVIVEAGQEQYDSVIGGSIEIIDVKYCLADWYIKALKKARVEVSNYYRRTYHKSLTRGDLYYFDVEEIHRKILKENK